MTPRTSSFAGPIHFLFGKWSFFSNIRRHWQSNFWHTSLGRLFDIPGPFLKLDSHQFCRVWPTMKAFNFPKCPYFEKASVLECVNWYFEYFQTSLHIFLLLQSATNQVAKSLHKLTLVKLLSFICCAFEKLQLKIIRRIISNVISWQL